MAGSAQKPAPVVYHDFVGRDFFWRAAAPARRDRGFIIINFEAVLAGALLMALVDFLLLYFAAKVFQRETILTRWK